MGRIKLGELYIPHGSDEPYVIGSINGCIITLYIPHGSDEPKVENSLLKTFQAFISHMVQMNLDRD
ncbi:MAG: hypothetical protein XD67_0213 [Thermodesulfobacterium commune]|nr:MAG: hypothetical protein XD67_0213 [Thermodesulfobacterium commune]